MNKLIQIVAILLLTAAFSAAVPVLAETTVAKSANTDQADNLETTKRLIARLTYIKKLALENLKKVAPEQVEQVDTCLEQVKQLIDERLDLLSDAAAILKSSGPPATPLISPFERR